MRALLYSECRGSKKDDCIGNELTECFFVWVFFWGCLFFVCACSVSVLLKLIIPFTLSVVGK